MVDTYILIIMALYNNRTVSVIIPVYNVAKYIAHTIESVLKQSYKDVEIILVDDCSTDNSAEIIKKYTSFHSNVVSLQLESNQGAAVARNKALSTAKGRYVAFLDGDDVWREGKLEKQLALMDEKEAAISCTALDTIDAYGESLGSIREVREKIDYNFLLHNTMIATSTVIVDRNKTGNFQMPLRRGGQDYATWLMLMRNGTICYGLNEVLSRYRVLSDSLSSNKWKSIKQVWNIQTKDEEISKISAIVNVCCFIANAFVKHFIK